MKTANLIGAFLMLSIASFALGMQNSSPTPTPTPAPGEVRPRPQKIRVSSGVMEGLVLHKVAAKYPAEARKEHIQGDVVLQILISREGDVAQMKPLKGEPILANAAMEAVKQWKYKPYLLNGEPVEVETTVVIKFHT